MIWERCNGAQHITALKGTLMRLVESQEHVATMSMVDTLDEQALLEDMLEGSKPPYSADTSSDNLAKYDYLLKSPFRYPPLKWGSRFGQTHERSLFYGATNATTVLAESAYYRFIFWYSMHSDQSITPPKAMINTQHSMFAADYQTERGIQLQAPPFNEYQTSLTHPQDYSASQTIGTAMRNADVQAFEYTSARDEQQGTCVALFTIEAMKSKKPKNLTRWQCQLTADEVSFKQVGQREVIRFALEGFLVDGELPGGA